MLRPLRIPRKPSSAIDWTAFATRADYRGLVLLPVASRAWARYAGQAGVTLETRLARDGAREVYRWLCANIPNQAFRGGDSRSDVAGEITLDFMVNFFDEPTVRASMVGLAGLPCGPQR